MLPRQLRVGDLVDDYCPRERRLTDHAIVAMVGDDVRQVRCSACNSEHEYRQGKLPVSRKKKPVVAPPPLAPAQTSATVVSDGEEAAPAVQPGDQHGAPDTLAASPAATGTTEGPAGETAEPGPDAPTADGPFHRRLIRATLPRIEGDVPTRPIPEFTMHRAAAPTHRKPFRPGPGGQHRMGGKPGHGPVRHGGGRPGQGPGSADGNTFGNRGGRGAHGGPPASRHDFGPRSSRGPKKH
ncbi:MAG: hypothetical protein NTY02_02255 [Acidobacteria bacterium]|nr:hypothetical protein [Acidobacteriota bacterium]